MTDRVLRQVSGSYVIPESLRKLGFSRRQYRVASALLSGATNKQIARQLGTTEATVKYHVTSLYRLSGVRRRRDFIDFMVKIQSSSKN
jgi:DNA-binding NarL/FixJ family response regulator